MTSRPRCRQEVFFSLLKQENNKAGTGIALSQIAANMSIYLEMKLKAGSGHFISRQLVFKYSI